MKKNTGVVCAISLAILAGTFIEELHAARYTIDPDAKGNRVTFLSKAPLESFEGTTSHVSGYVVVDPTHVTGKVSLHFEVDLESLDTGKSKRNKHMRERHLETDTYPTATFSGATIVEGSAAKLVAGTLTTFDLEGDFEIHGVVRRMIVHAEVTLSTDGGHEALHIVARFDVALSDYDISRPRFLFMKLNDIQKVTVELTAVLTQ